MAVPARRARRPIDKKLVAVLKAGVDATDVSTTLVTITFPATIVGLRWSLNFAQAAGTGLASHYWAIVIVREGVTVDSLGVSDAASFFNPEENCLVFGAGNIINNTETLSYEGSTKTMRKMQGGDTLQLIIKGEATNTTDVLGVVQFFLKT